MKLVSFGIEFIVLASEVLDLELLTASQQRPRLGWRMEMMELMTYLVTVAMNP